MKLINIFAVLVATGIYFLVHLLWYFPWAFGNLWLKLLGKKEESKQKIIRETILMVFTSFVTNLILALILDFIPHVNVFSGLLVSLLLYAGFVLPISLNQDAFIGRTNWKLFLIEYGVYLILFLISGLILSLWR